MKAWQSTGLREATLQLAVDLYSFNGSLSRKLKCAS